MTDESLQGQTLQQTVHSGPEQPNGRQLLRLDGVDTYYGQIHILQDVALEVAPAELVCLLGGNASGKSTTSTRPTARSRRSRASR